MCVISIIALQNYYIFLIYARDRVIFLRKKARGVSRESWTGGVWGDADWQSAQQKKSDADNGGKNTAKWNDRQPLNSQSPKVNSQHENTAGKPLHERKRAEMGSGCLSRQVGRTSAGRD